jgi:hypothetical protein
MPGNHISKQHNIMVTQKITNINHISKLHNIIIIRAGIRKHYRGTLATNNHKFIMAKKSQNFSNTDISRCSPNNKIATIAMNIECIPPVNSRAPPEPAAPLQSHVSNRPGGLTFPGKRSLLSMPSP